MAELKIQLIAICKQNVSQYKPVTLHVNELNCSFASNNFNTKPSRLSIQANSFSRIGVKVWNEIPQALRNLSKNAFKRKLEQILFNILGSQDSYIDLSQIIS